MSKPRIKRKNVNRAVKFHNEDPQGRELLKQHDKDSRERFGREPGPGDPLICDPYAETPRPVNVPKFIDRIVEAIEKAGIDPAKIYACRKTRGLIVTSQNEYQISARDLSDWNSAEDVYRRSHGKTY